ncbi:MAG: 30S ribosomal protein S8e [Nitrososphaerota archaeon]
MVQWHTSIHKRKKTGGKRGPSRGRRRRERGGEINTVSLGEPEVAGRRAMGGFYKYAVKSTKYVNLAVPGSGAKRVEIIRVISNPSNRDYERRKVITKGAIIETPLGQAVVTSSPGQSGSVDAVLLKGGAS